MKKYLSLLWLLGCLTTTYAQSIPAPVLSSIDNLSTKDAMLQTLKVLSKKGLQKQVAKDKSSLDTFEVTSVLKDNDSHSFIVERIHYPCNVNDKTIKLMKVVYNSSIEKNMLVYLDKSLTQDKVIPVGTDAKLDEKRALLCSKLS